MCMNNTNLNMWPAILVEAILEQLRQLSTLIRMDNNDFFNLLLQESRLHQIHYHSCAQKNSRLRQRKVEKTCLNPFVFDLPNWAR